MSLRIRRNVSENEVEKRCVFEDFSPFSPFFLTKFLFFFVFCVFAFHAFPVSFFFFELFGTSTVSAAQKDQLLKRSGAARIVSRHDTSTRSNEDETRGQRRRGVNDDVEKA